MNKMFSFLAGALSGALVGAVLGLLLTPASGEELRADVTTRLQNALEEGRRAMEETNRTMMEQFEQMKSG
ncbi:MAG: YtxH domain-containing protein [Ardenticatenaceae bacterium]|nr:YtxH domain-containing protein [Ardenticatenaceae bacterium]